MAHSKRQRKNRREQAAREQRASRHVEGVGYRSALGMLPLIREPILRVVFVNLSPEVRNAWCRTPGALYRKGLIPRLGAGLVTFDPAGRCT
jgi:hypothetical protein